MFLSTLFQNHYIVCFSLRKLANRSMLAFMQNFSNLTTKILINLFSCPKVELVVVALLLVKMPTIVVTSCFLVMTERKSDLFICKSW